VRHLVKGGGGFIGSHLADVLIARGHEVLVLEDFSTGRTENVEHLVEAPGFELVRGVTLVTYEEAYEPGFEEHAHRVPDTTALHQLTGWMPTRSLEETIDDVIAYAANRLRAIEPAAVAN
jgi:nucleoside-diphosphate-sugar epimerase